MPALLASLLELLPLLGFAAPAILLVVVVLILFFNPEKIEKWSALLWKVCYLATSLVGAAWGYAQKQYIKHDLQGRINDFVRTLRYNVPGVAQGRCKVEWVDPITERASFIANDRVVLRLRRDDPHDQNFIHGAYLFVSSSLLLRPKRYVSPPFREALDLFVCSKLLKRERPAVVSFFVDEYLHPRTADPKSRSGQYLDDFAVIDSAGLFFPIVVQELEYLGGKVFGNRRTNLVMEDVSGLVDFMKPIALRQVGDEGDLNYDGKYCRFGIVIVGKRVVLENRSITPYLQYIRQELVANRVETIYLLSSRQNRASVDAICEHLKPGYECVRRTLFRGLLRFRNRESQAIIQFLAILRKQGIELIQPSLPRPQRTGEGARVPAEQSDGS